MSWQPKASGTDATLSAVWGADGHRIWVIGENGTILRHEE
jgi:photosystem II stability/assembly factor-like uncharacterized protein